MERGADLSRIAGPEWGSSDPVLDGVLQDPEEQDGEAELPPEWADDVHPLLLFRTNDPEAEANPPPWVPPRWSGEYRPVLVGPARECQWPAWSHGERPSHVYCAAPSLPERSYCADHCARIFQRRPRAAQADQTA